MCRSPLAAATAAGVGALPAMAAIELPTGTDPHVAWWRELQAVHRELDGERMGDKDLLERQRELEDLIAETPPTTREGALAIAAMIVVSHERLYEGDPLSHLYNPEEIAGNTLAHWLLAQQTA